MDRARSRLRMTLAPSGAVARAGACYVFVWNHMVATFGPPVIAVHDSHLQWPSKNARFAPSLCRLEMLLVSVGLQMGQ